MKIKSISIAGMHTIGSISKKYTFKDINYIIGKNGAGKSTILQAIQLAILGYIPGTDKRVSEIFNHSSSKAMTIDLILTNDDSVDETSSEDVKIVRSWFVKGKSIQSSVTTNPEDFKIESLVSQIELPIFNFNEFLGLSRNQLKSWFLNFLPEPDCKIDWKQEFENTLFESGHVLAEPSYLDEVLEEGVDGDTGLSSVQNTNTKLKELLSAKKLEVARLEGAVQALVFYDDIEAEDYEDSKDTIEDRLNEIQVTRREVESAISDSKHNQYVESQIATAKSSLLSDEEVVKNSELLKSAEESTKRLSERYEELQNTREQLNSECSTIRAKIAMKESVLRGNGICPYTQETCSSIKKYLENVSNEIEELKTYHDEQLHKNAELEPEMSTVNENLSKLDEECQAARIRLQKHQEAAEYIDKLSGDIIVISEEAKELLQISPNAFDDEESQLRDKLTKLEANKVYEEKINSLTKMKFKAENEMAALKLFIKHTDANNMQTKIAELPFAEFTEVMNDVIPQLFGDSIKFKINLESKANSFSFGIEKSTPTGEIYIPYDLMSSGEKTLFAFVMMLYIVHESSAKLKLVMIDDMLDHLDDTNIISLFSKFTDTNIQIINAGVKRVDNDKINLIEV